MTSKSQYLTQYQQFKDKIYNYFWYRVAFNRELAEDLTSEVFLKAFKHYDDYDPERPFQAWIYRIAHNHLLNHYRQNGREVDLNDDLKIGTEPGPDIELKIDCERLKNMVDCLPAGPRDVLMMRYFDGLEYEEMSDVLGRETGTVRVQVSRALALLRQNIIDKYGSLEDKTQ